MVVHPYWKSDSHGFDFRAVPYFPNFMKLSLKNYLFIQLLDTISFTTLTRMTQFDTSVQVVELDNIIVTLNQKRIRVETCNGPLCAGKQASEHSIC